LKDKGFPGKWAERISFSGVIKADANYEKMNFADPDTEDKGLGINKISHHPGNEFPGCYVPSLRDLYMSCKDVS